MANTQANAKTDKKKTKTKNNKKKNGKYDFAKVHVKSLNFNYVPLSVVHDDDNDDNANKTDVTTPLHCAALAGGATTMLRTSGVACGKRKMANESKEAEGGKKA